LELINDFAKNEDSEVVAICAELEAEISTLPVEEKKEFLSDIGQAESGLDRVIKAGYKLLGLQTYFTAGEKEVRAWTINIGDQAPRAAGKIHTDFEKGFIRAETIAFEDFVENDGEKAQKKLANLDQKVKIILSTMVMLYTSYLAFS
jgi:ribosome-binding ATPase YchF (GTP1/OBG family)